ncbi:MAG: tol-pal system protein YbgF, partial [Bacteroidetes bacterium]|nr:tol-pal system protein YbgF [Bacteroidota bacterium]
MERLLIISKGKTNLVVFILTFLAVSIEGISQEVEQKILISDMKIQIETTEAVNNLYNFKFEKAEMQFRWLLQKYDWHPLPYFLLGLSEWWKILPER